jgi:hypothetical protein
VHHGRAESDVKIILEKAKVRACLLFALLFNQYPNFKVAIVMKRDTFVSLWQQPQSAPGFPGDFQTT